MLEQLSLAEKDTMIRRRKAIKEERERRAELARLALLAATKETVRGPPEEKLLEHEPPGYN